MIGRRQPTWLWTAALVLALSYGLHAAGYDLALHYRTSAAPMRVLAGELEAVRSGSVLTLQADLAEFDPEAARMA